MRGHGPRSKACRAAATARDTSSLPAAATRTHTSSVAGWTTSMTWPPPGVTHSPPMYRRSGYLTGTAYALSTAMGWSFSYRLLEETLVLHTENTTVLHE